MKNIVRLCSFHQKLYCPVTGKMIHSPDVYMEPSEATVFIFSTIYGEFDYSRDGFEEAFAQVKEDAKEHISHEDAIEKTIDKMNLKKLLLFAVELKQTDGCGHHEATRYIGIDFSYTKTQ